LYGHNAGHALAGYLAQLLGFTRIDELTARPDVIDFVRRAMIEESGVPLCRRYAGVDPLFTDDGFCVYAEDLIVRMLNPFVRDTVARVGRDPARKLGWEDRLVGAMRLALAEGVTPRRYAWGAAAALQMLAVAPPATPAFLAGLWAEAGPAAAEQRRVLAYVAGAQAALAAWIGQGFSVLAAGDGQP
jgi:mannitol-1-phosphate 5-dehydrogenase